MSQQEAQTTAPPPEKKKSSAGKWIAVVVVIIIIAAAAVVLLSHKSTTTTTTTTTALPATITPTSTGLSAQAGSPLTFFTNLPSNVKFTKVVWNFGNGVTQTVTSGNGEVTYTYNTPGSYLVSVTVYNSTSSVSNNQSLLLVTVTPGLTANPAAIYGPITVKMNSAGNTNQSIPAGGWINLSYSGLTAATPIMLGSPVPGDPSYTVSAFQWNIDNGTSVILNTNIKNSNGTANMMYAGTVNLTFSTPGFHTVELNTISTGPSGNITGSFIMTVVVGNYAVLKVAPKVAPNKNMIVDATWIPGGPRTFDPAIAYDTVSYEVVYEIYQPLVFYNGTSTTQFNPVIAKYVPTVQNGGIVVNTTTGAENITFYINTSLQFSNGDHVNAYDVYISFARTLLFANDPGDPGWIIAHALLPAPSIYGPFNNSFYWVHHAITWNNATQSVTFHLLPAVPTWLPNTSAVYAGVNYGVLNQSYPVHNFGANAYFLQLISGPTAGDIMDYNWLVQHGAAPANNSASYSAFANPSNGPGVSGYFNTYIQYNTLGTGPYELKLYEPSQEVILTANPYYHQTPGLLPPSKLIPEVVIEYLSQETTAQQQFASGQAQFAEGAYPVDATPLLLNLVNSGVAGMTSVGQLATFSFFINFAINITGAQIYDSQTNIPAGFFANLNVRKAFYYAFNQTYWIDVANSNSGITFAENLSGIIPRGMPEYPANLSAQAPEVYNLTLAKYYWSLTPYAKNGAKLYIPLFNTLGNPTVDEMYSVYEQALSAMSNGQIVATTYDITFSQELAYTSVGPGQNPMPIYFLGWIDDYPDASDFVAPFYQPYGIYTYPDGIIQTNPYFNPSTNPNQWANITMIWNYLNLAEESTNQSLVDLYYYLAEKIAMSQYLYIGIMQPLAYLVYSTTINPNSLALTENPVVGASFLVFYTMQYNS
jgi:peptide/nickel transport system substrate-binding protein